MSETFAILLVEDQDEHALFTEKALRKAGLQNQILRATDGDQALDIVFRRGAYSGGPPIGLVLLDLRLPKVDGVDVLRQIRQNGDMRHMVVVMLTTSDESSDVAECMRLGANSYVTKPVDWRSFSERLQQVGLYWVQTDKLLKPPSR